MRAIAEGTSIGTIPETDTMSLTAIPAEGEVIQETATPAEGIEMSQGKGVTDADGPLVVIDRRDAIRKDLEGEAQGIVETEIDHLGTTSQLKRCIPTSRDSKPRPKASRISFGTVSSG